MIAVLDVQYHNDDTASSACVLIENYQSDDTISEHVVTVSGIEPYKAGEFYRRELPCLLEALDQIDTTPDEIVIDGYVDLIGKKGLGRWLFEALDEKIPVVGVAKTRYSNSDAQELLRTNSERPLFVTSAGVNTAEACDKIESMHGDYRIPTMLRRVDQIARGLVDPKPPE